MVHRHLLLAERCGRRAVPSLDQTTRRRYVWSKWCVLNEDNADGQAFGAGMKAAAEAFHATIVASETFSPGTKDSPP